MLRRVLLIGVLTLCLSLPLSANIVNVDLSGATTGTLIDGVGASFAQTFVGQTVVGTGITGSPTDPLTLAPSGTLDIEFFNGSNSILPQPNNQAPLSVLLDSVADSVTWTMGHADSTGPVTIDFFAADGSLVSEISQALTLGYANYTFSGIGAFAGFTIFNNNDPAGLRFQDFSYNVVPEPGSLLLLGTGLLGLVGVIRRLRAKV